MTNKPEKKAPTKAYESKEKAWNIAEYYGFQGIEPSVVEKSDIAIGKKLDTYEVNSVLFPKTVEKLALLRTYINQKLYAGPQPIMMYYEGIPHVQGERKKKTKGLYTLEILGTTKSVAEAILIKTAYVILTELGHKNLVVTVNSVGDKDAFARFTRELTAYYRKNIAVLSVEEREHFKKDALLLSWHSYKGNKTKQIHEEIPESVSFLSDKSRTHFKEVLEYLEHFNIQYRVMRSLISNKSFAAETVFGIDSIDPDGKEVRLAFGSRYSALGKKLEHKRDVPAVGITIETDAEHTEIKGAAKKLKPIFYYIQLGFEAKLKSLELIEKLRVAGIAIEQSLSKDKLGAQLGIAENLKFPYVLIMGQKEAIEGTVLVRSMENRSQEAVAVGDLVAHMKKLLAAKPASKPAKKVK